MPGVVQLRQHSKLIAHVMRKGVKVPEMPTTFAGKFLLIGVLLLAVPVAAPGQDKAPLLWGVDVAGGLPYFLKDPNRPSEYIGFEMDLVRALEKELGRRI